MKALVITVAGISSRFNKGMDREYLKCIYSEGGKPTILESILEKAHQYDLVVIVGGYRYNELQSYMQSRETRLGARLKMIHNPFYQQYGTGYSLYLGLRSVEEERFDEIVFLEGDLYFDRNSFDRLTEVSGDALTIVNQPIYAERSVVVYLDREEKPHYVFDSCHGLLSIMEPFKAIFNSAQMWKFYDPQRLYWCLDEMADHRVQGTNLEIVQEYFGSLARDRYHVIPISEWTNCNTIEDYRRIFAGRSVI